MLIRLIGTVIVLVLLVFFAGFNLDNKCAVNLLFHKFEDVPVFFTIIISFVMGIVFTLPFTFIHRALKNKKKIATTKEEKPSSEQKPIEQKSSETDENKK